MRSSFKRAAVLLALAPQLASAQGIRRVALGTGVDTTSAAWTDVAWHAAVPEIYREWRAYLMAGRGTAAGASHWSAAERQQWPAYDLTTLVAPFEESAYNATVLDIRPAVADSTAVYVVKTLIARVAGQDVQPAAQLRVYGQMESGRWVFGNALPRETEQWLRADVGPINYLITPSGGFDRERGQEVVDFADSVAARFGVDRIPQTTYVLANDADELYHALGVDWTFGAFNVGFVSPQDHLILHGTKIYAEENRNAIVKTLMAPLAARGRTHPIVNDGVATWLGGTGGMFFDELMPKYTSFLVTNPRVTIDSILDGAGPADAGWNPIGALLVHMVYERAGFVGVKDLFTSGSSNAELRVALVRLFGVSSWAEVNDKLRARALEFAAPR